MSDDSNNNPNSSGTGQNRRSSFAGDTFASIFGTRRSNSMSNRPAQSVSEGANASQPTQQYPGPITTAAAQAQRRRLSLTTLGLGGAPNQPGVYRRESAVSSNSGSIDESVVEDDMSNGPTPQTPFGRRMSFGARALRDVRGSGSAGGGGPGGGGEQNEGFNWSDNFSSRAKRTSIAPGQGNSPPAAGHVRSKSVATMEPPVQEMPKPHEPNRPDHFQERILKGDFYMD